MPQPGDAMRSVASRHGGKPWNTKRPPCSVVVVHDSNSASDSKVTSIETSTPAGPCRSSLGVPAETFEYHTHPTRPGAASSPRAIATGPASTAAYTAHTKRRMPWLFQKSSGTSTHRVNIKTDFLMMGTEKSMVSLDRIILSAGDASRLRDSWGAMDSPSRGGVERYAFTPLLHTTVLLDHAVGDAHEAALKTARPSTPKYSFPRNNRTYTGLNTPCAFGPLLGGLCGLLAALASFFARAVTCRRSTAWKQPPRKPPPQTSVRSEPTPTAKHLP